MNCPKCKTKDKFKVDRSSIYCMAKPDGKICGYTLNKKEKDYYRNEKKILNNADNDKTRRKYVGLSVSQIAKLNDVHRNTVTKHLDEFDIIPVTNPTRYRFNKKLLKENWKTLKEKELKKYVPVIDFQGYQFILDDKGKPII